MINFADPLIACSPVDVLTIDVLKVTIFLSSRMLSTSEIPSISSPSKTGFK